MLLCIFDRFRSLLSLCFFFCVLLNTIPGTIFSSGNWFQYNLFIKIKRRQGEIIAKVMKFNYVYVSKTIFNVAKLFIHIIIAKLHSFSFIYSYQLLAFVNWLSQWLILIYIFWEIIMMNKISLSKTTLWIITHDILTGGGVPKVDSVTYVQSQKFLPENR